MTKKLYKCRSKVAHGREIKENVAIEEESVPIEKFIICVKRFLKNLLTKSLF